MNPWKQVTLQADIGELLDVYGGFHDSCIVSLSYVSGNAVNTQCAMGLDRDTQAVRILFHRQWEPRVLELCFTGPRLLHLACPNELYFGEILDVFLACCQDVLPDHPDPVIVWANYDTFDVDTIRRGVYDPGDTFLVADRLKWRILEDGAENPGLM